MFVFEIGKQLVWKKHGKSERTFAKKEKSEMKMKTQEMRKVGQKIGKEVWVKSWIEKYGV